MLVLGRKKNQKIIIQTSAGPVYVQIADIRGSLVKVGIEAPDDIKIFREEIYSDVQNSQSNK